MSYIFMIIRRNIKKTLILTGILITAGAVIGIQACTSMGIKAYDGERRVKIEKSGLYKNGKFMNIDGNKPIMQGSSWAMWKEFIFGKQLRVPEKPLEVLTIDADSVTGGGENELRVTWLGHSSSIIEIEGNIILVDPVFSNRPSPVFFAGPLRYHNKLPLMPENFPAIDLVIISHDHYDHLDYDTIMKLHNRVKRFTVPLGVGAYLEKWGVDPVKITELGWWESVDVKEGLRITAAPAQHFSGRSPFNRNETLWASWVIAGRSRRVFYSGDSGYTPVFKEIGKKYGPFDITLLENGQYNRSWERVHMLPEQTVKAHLELRGGVLIPVHWAAYNLSIHDWFEPVERLLKAAEGKNITVATPRIGERVVYGKPLPAIRWWPVNEKDEKPVAKISNENCRIACNEE